MSSSTIIELKELQGGVKEQAELPNGFYKQVLKNPITIENGDELSIHAGFIDTIQSSQGKIDIDGTETFKIGYTPFIQNFDKQAKVYNGRTPNFSSTSGFTFDNKAYYPCIGGHTPSGDLVLIDSITFNRKDNEPDNWGNVSAFFSFVNENGVDTGITVNLPKIPASFGDGYVYAINKVCKSGTFKFGEDSKELKSFERKGKIASFSFNQSAYTASNLNLEPLAFEYSFSLPEGSYEPKHICELITEKLTDLQNVSSNDLGQDDDPVDNAFLKTNDQINNINGVYNGEGKTIYVNQDGNGILQLPDTQHYPSSSTDPNDIVPGFSGNTYGSFVGSDQVVLEFDEDTQKCVWSQLHSNIYSNGSSDGSGGYNEDGSIIIKSFNHDYTPPADGSDEYIYASRAGCIGINYLQPSSFWYDKLGLDPNICITFEPHLRNGTLGTFNNIDTYKVQGGLIDGENTTNSVASSSVVITKNQFYNQVPSRSSIEGTTTSNIKCYGLNSLNAPTLEEGYFLISIDGFDNNQKLISRDDERNTIKSIVSRFYTTNSYTSFYNEGNVANYQHYGEPITISSFTVRILNPEYKQANIQSDNTIFLELIKPLPQLKQ